MAEQQFSGLLTGFGSGSSFTSVSSANRIKVWDVATGELHQEFTDPSHLGIQYTCLAQTRPRSESSSASSSGRKKSRSAQSDSLPGSESAGFLALGTNQGAISVWDLSQGSSFQLSGEQDSASLSVSDVCFNAAGTRLYSCARDGSVSEWNVKSKTLLQTWRPEPVSNDSAFTKLVLTPDETRLVIGGNHITVWDLATQSVVLEFSGHKSPIQSLAVSPDGKFCASSAAERTIRIWSLLAGAEGSTPSKQRRRRKKRTVQVEHSSLSTPQDPVSLHFNPRHNKSGPATSDSSSYHLAAVLPDSVCVWDWEPPTSPGSKPQPSTPASKKSTGRKRKTPEEVPEQASSSGRISSQSSLSLPPLEVENPSASRSRSLDWKKRRGNHTREDMLHFRIQSIHFVSPYSLVVARQQTRPHFQRVDYKPPPSVDILGGLIPKIQLPSVSDVILQGGGKKYDGPGKTPVDVLSTFTGASASGAAGGASQLTSALPGDPESKVREAQDLVSMSLAERLAAFAQLQQKRQEQEKETKESAATVVTPSAGSLHHVMSQAIKTNDQLLLEECFTLAQGARNTHMIRRTVERLAPDRALELVRIIIRTFKRSPARGPQLLPWLKHIFTIHTSYLVSLPWLRSELVELNGLVDMRLGAFKKMLRLKGRLELIMGQTQAETPGDAELHNDEPRAVYVESEDAPAAEEDSSDLEDMEDDDDV